MEIVVIMQIHGVLTSFFYAEKSCSLDVKDVFAVLCNEMIILWLLDNQERPEPR